MSSFGGRRESEGGVEEQAGDDEEVFSLTGPLPSIEKVSSRKHYEITAEVKQVPRGEAEHKRSVEMIELKQRMFFQKTVFAVLVVVSIAALYVAVTVPELRDAAMNVVQTIVVAFLSFLLGKKMK